MNLCHIWPKQLPKLLLKRHCQWNQGLLRELSQVPFKSIKTNTQMWQPAGKLGALREINKVSFLYFKSTPTPKVSKKQVSYRVEKSVVPLLNLAGRFWHLVSYKVWTLDTLQWANPVFSTATQTLAPRELMAQKCKRVSMLTNGKALEPQPTGRSKQLSATGASYTDRQDNCATSQLLRTSLTVPCLSSS